MADPESGIVFEPLSGDPRGIPQPAYALRSNRLVKEEIGIEADDAAFMTKKQLNRHKQLNTNLKLGFVVECATESLERERLYKDLAWYVPFLLLFIFFLLASRNTEGMFWNNQVIGVKGATEERTFPFWGKTFMDTANRGDWEAWLEQVLIPMYFDDGAADAATNIVMGNNIKVGAMRVRAIRVANNSCDLNTRIIDTNASLFPQTCFGRYKGSDGESRDRDPFGDYPFHECKSPGIMKVEGKIRNWHCGGNVLDMPFNATVREATRELTNGAVGSFFADASTSRFLMVEYVHYNPTLNVFSHAQQWVEISAGGAYLPQTRTVFFEVMTSSMRGTQAYTVIFFLAVLIMVARFIYLGICASRRGELGKFIFSLWNILELINLIIFIVMLAFRFAWWAKCIDLDFQLPAGRAGFNEDLHFIAALYDMSIFLNGVNTVIIFIKVLKFAPLNRRLRIVTRSIVRAQQNIVGLMILFVVVLLAFAITAMSLFGTGMEDYRNLEVSFSTLMRTVIGDFDYDAMREENLFLAGIFFWAYMLLALFLLLNFIIAVIGNAFGQESADLVAEPLDAQIAGFFKDVKRQLARFVRSPGLYIRQAVQRRNEEWARESRYVLLCEELRAYRASLPIEGVSQDDFDDLPEAEKLALLPDPPLIRTTINEIVNARPDGALKLGYLSEVFLDDFWLACVAEHHLHDNTRNRALLKRHKLMADCAERQLRGVLGLGGEPIADAMSLRDLLEPSEQSVTHLAAMLERVGRMEALSDSLGATLCRLDVMLSAALQPKQAGRAGGEDGGDDAGGSDVQMLPLQIPKSKLTPL